MLARWYPLSRSGTSKKSVLEFALPLYTGILTRICYCMMLHVLQLMRPCCRWLARFFARKKAASGVDILNGKADIKVLTGWDESHAAEITTENDVDPSTAQPLLQTI